MERKKKWVAFFSHTGSNIAMVANALRGDGRDLEIHVVCDHAQGIADDICEEYFHEQPFYNSFTILEFIDDVSKSDTYRIVLDEYNLEEGDIITLNGWMHIIPEDICNEYEIYNLHPALINEYPELKGKDPQERIINDFHRVGDKNYELLGAVIHRVTAGIDEGEIVKFVRRASYRALNQPPIKASREDIYQGISFLSDELMIAFMKEKFE